MASRLVYVGLGHTLLHLVVRPLLRILGQSLQQVRCSVGSAGDKAFDTRLNLPLHVDQGLEELLGLGIELGFCESVISRARDGDDVGGNPKPDHLFNEVVIRGIVSVVEVAEEGVIREERRTTDKVVGSVGVELGGKELGGEGVHGSVVVLIVRAIAGVTGHLRTSAGWFGRSHTGTEDARRRVRCGCLA